MRRSERHHLKENVVADTIIRLATHLNEWGRGLMVACGVLLCILIFFGLYSWWSGQATSRAEVSLARALVIADAPVVPPPPPSTEDQDNESAQETSGGETVGSTPAPEFVQPPGTYPTMLDKMSAALPLLLETAETYSGTQPSTIARYRAGNTLAALGRLEEAAEQYRELIANNGSGFYSLMATLGLADVQVARGDYDEAIALLEQSSSDNSGEIDLPLDGVLMLLGRAYELAGRAGDARMIFQRVVEEFPGSFYFSSAQRELQELNIGG